MLGQKGSWNTTVISDSEDERLRRRSEKADFAKVIEIPTDDSDDDSQSKAPPARATGPVDYKKSSKGQPQALSVKTRVPSSTPKKVFGANYLRSRVVESSDSESDEKPRRLHSQKPRLSQAMEEKSEPSASGPKKTATLLFLKKQGSSMVVEVGSDSDDDGAIMVFDEPPSARKPLRKPLSKASITGEGTNPVNDVFGMTGPRDDHPPSDSHLELPDVAPVAPRPSPKKKPSRTPRVNSKKAKEEQQEKLYTYASSLFEELNRTVFKGGLPADTKLNWNKRLLTTAGRAKWHKSRDAVQTSEIELAEKILTSRERIRNTLSHEMCHLAAWVIDKEIKEGHGRFWKAWTRRVMARYPEIDISTRHDYEIEYPYKWKCAKCDKIYGRFSKSIKPDECVCGACREGRLMPQFKTNARAPKTPKMSRLAASKTQGSPFTPTTRDIPATSTPVAREVIEITSDSEDDTDELPQTYYHHHTRASICEIGASGSDSEIEILATALTATNIVD
ncbi:hypothetical protein D9611_003404 [Ephemerocybe angulata]|uniref:SprT-like domain-containing protein n=1 Tax=Ephemerocybe angulata TaxID=980116 RepID=A0A8H5CB24_9AGAR|nr:hypothetical protein D9611_003404 [Tulosesus angulatus]